MRNRIPILCAIVVAGAHLSNATDLFFYASPYRVDAGGAVMFHYLPEKGIPRERIASWAWDFDGDGTVDAQGLTAEGINATWYATYSEAEADLDGVCRVLPVLTVVDTSGIKHVQTGITEDVYGTDGNPDSRLLIYPYNARNYEASVDFLGGPRLVTTDAEVRLFSDAKLLQDGQILRQIWDLGDGTIAEGASARHSYTNHNEYTVSLTVEYVLDSNKAVTNRMTETKNAYITVEDPKGNLALGRAYRKGYPDEYTWSDIIKAYSAKSADGDKYLYYHYFERAYNDALTSLYDNPYNEDRRRDATETVNEILQGQVMLGNDRLVDALRMKYPRMISYDPLNPPETLPKPPGVREETQAIDVALLDYYSALLYPASLLQRYGPSILRSRATPGAEPYPNFPQYLTFLDPSLSPYPVPIKNEYWQFATCLERMALGSYEKAKKLFNLSLSQPEARDEAKAECKKTAMQSYLGMALLGACQNETDFEMNEGNLVLSHLSNSRNLFEMINAGLNPLIDNGDYIPNESFAAIYQDAQEAVSDVLEAEVKARQEEKTWDTYQAELRNELLAQRNNYITPLYNLTHIDPGLYNNLATVDDQRDYRNAVHSRVNAILENYPNSDPSTLGELGDYVFNWIESINNLLEAQNSVKNLYQRISIIQWKNTEMKTIYDNYAEQLAAQDVAAAEAEGALQVGASVLGGAIAGYMAQSKFKNTSAEEALTKASSSLLTEGATTAISTALSAALGDAMSEKTKLQAMQSAELSDVETEADCRTLLLDLANLQIEIEKMSSRIKQARLALDNALSRMDRLVEDLAHTRDTAADLYFNDPSYRVVVSEAMQRAESEMDYAIDKLYRLARTLEYWWAEPYRNPISIPVNCNEAASLENPLFDQFTQLESLFQITCADEAKDYLDALKAWDSKLRRISLTSVRGPNNAGPITAEPISLREDILGFRTDNGTLTMDESITAFRQYLKDHTVENFYNVWNPSIEVHFPTEIADNKFFPATGERWNMRIDSISIDIYAESGFSKKQVAEVSLTESGMVSLRRFWAEPPLADDLMHMSFHVGVRSDRTAYGITVPSKINGATGNRPAAEFLAYGLQGRPIAATDWILKIDTENPSNKDIDFSKIKDIVIRFTYTYGNPPEFPGF